MKINACFAALTLGGFFFEKLVPLARAENAEWKSIPPLVGQIGNWNDENNWNPTTIPNGSADTASFSVTQSKNLFLGANVEVNRINFSTGAAANPFTITIDEQRTLKISGVGIINYSSEEQNFSVAASSVEEENGARLVFANSAVVLGQIKITNAAATNSVATHGGITEIRDNARTGESVIVASGTNASSISSGGIVSFFDNSSAGNSILIATGNTLDRGGKIQFFNNSKGANATVQLFGSGSLEVLTSQPLSIGSLAGDGKVLLGSGFLGIGGNNQNTTFSGSITEFGVGEAEPLSANIYLYGSGTLTLSGRNTYSGETNVAVGKLQIESSLSLGSGGYRVFNNFPGNKTSGTLVMAKNTDAGEHTFYLEGGEENYLLGARMVFTDDSRAGLSYFKVVGGWDNANAEGAKLTFEGNASAADGVFTVEGGVGEGAAGGSIEFTENSTIENGRFVVFEGRENGLGGSLRILKNVRGGTARFSINGSLDLSDRGTQVLEIGSLFGDGTVFLGESVLSIGTGDENSSFEGTINDAGSINHSNSLTSGSASSGALIKTGIGYLILEGTNTYTGATTINEGILELNGSVMSTDVLVNINGVLSGHGTAFGNVFNSGVVSPGNSPGTLTVIGNFNQAAGGTLQVEIASATSFDLLSVGGVANLDGNLQIITLGAYEPATTAQITILNATGGVNGTFTTVDQSLSTVMFDVVYLTNSVMLEYSQTQFDFFFSKLGVTLSPNQKSVAVALDKSSSDSEQDKLVKFLLNQDIGHLPREFERIAPEELAAMFEITLANSEVHLRNISDQIARARSGRRGFISALSIQAPDGKRIMAPTDDKSIPDAFVASPDNDWSVWIDGTGEYVQVGNDSNARGFDFQTGGITFGLDYRFSENFIFGIAGSYTHTDTDLIENGTMDVEGSRLAIYGSWFCGGAYANTVAGGGYSRFDTHRRNINGFADGATDGQEFNALLDGGYDFKAGVVAFGPTASIGYIWSEIDSFSESNSLAPLEISQQDEESLRSRVGGHFAAEFKIYGIIWRPEFRAEWQHSYLDDNSTIDATFANGAGTEFSVEGPRTGRDSAILSAGVSVEWCPTIRTYLNYEAEVGRNNYDRQNVQVGLQLSF